MKYVLKPALMTTLLWTASCALPMHHPQADIRSLTEDSETERAILSHYRNIAELNASVGGKSTTFIINRPDITQLYENMIESRLRSDFQSIGRDFPLTADETYMLIGEQEDFRIVYIIPIRFGTVEGAYVSLPGLIYLVRKDRAEIVRFSSDEY